uniref:Dimer_Tnp_hAT domain-containing protein n=1 Tax=Meloidogyne hapla TaxID=6305 RepID=A0A1I8BYR9_MELHA
MSIADATGEMKEKILKKFDDVLAKNPGFETISKIGKVLSGQQIDLDMPPKIISLYKYAPLTSCDDERSFSSYKSILTDNRARITPEHMEMLLICNCYHNIE